MHQDIIYIAIAVVAAILTAAHAFWSGRRPVPHSAAALAADSGRRVAAAHASTAYARISVR
jgi:hypothetical protein